MKLIAGSILVGFSLLALTLGNLSIGQGGQTWIFPSESYDLYMGGMLELWAILLTIAGVALIIWDLWGMFRRRSD